MSSELESDVCYRVAPFGECYSTEVTAGLAESSGSLPPGGWFKKSPVGWLPVHRDQLRAQCSV